MFEFNDSSDSLEDFERTAMAQVTGFKRCRLSSPIRLDYISSGFVSLLGYTPEQIHELFNDESVGFVYPDDAQYYRNLLRRFSEKEMTATFHYRVICKDGSVKLLNDTMKSVMLNGEMWGFSCVSDATNMNAANSVGIESFLNPEAVVSLCFDMNTRKKMDVVGGVSQIPFENDENFDDVYNSLLALVHPQDKDTFTSNLLEWHLRESVGFECRVYIRSSNGIVEYRWVRITTVCYISPSGKRPMVLNIVDVNDRKLAEVNAVESMGKDWLTGLMSISAFHSLCLRRGFSDGGDVEIASNGRPTHVSLRSVDYAFFADYFDDKTLYKEPDDDYDFRAMGAIAFDSMPTSDSDVTFYEYYAAVKRAANAIKLASLDGDLTTRLDSGLFLIVPMNKLSRADYINRARILLSTMMVPLENGRKLSVRAGLVTCRIGETYENALACALQSLEEALKEPEPCVVFRSMDNPCSSYVQPVFSAEGYTRNLDTRCIESRDEDEGDLCCDDFEQSYSGGVVCSDVPSDCVNECSLLSEDDVAQSDATPQSSASETIVAYARTFGYFDVFVNGSAVVFRSQKAKELLALLVDHHGGFVTPAFAISCLWEFDPDNKSTRARYRKVALNLRRTLEEYGISDIMEEHNGSRRIIPERLNCDLFNYQAGNRSGKNEFRGVYLPDYSWGELTLAQLAHESLA